MAGKKSPNGRSAAAATSHVRRTPMREFSRSLPMSLLRAREAVMRQFRPSLRNHGLTEQQWRILRALTAVDAIEVTELARVAFLLGPSLSRILRDLEAPSDRTQGGESRSAPRRRVRFHPGLAANRGGRAVVGSDLCRHDRALWRPQARQTAGDAADARGLPVGVARRRRRRCRGDRLVGTTYAYGLGAPSREIADSERQPRKNAQKKKINKRKSSETNRRLSGHAIDT